MYSPTRVISLLLFIKIFTPVVFILTFRPLDTSAFVMSSLLYFDSDQFHCIRCLYPSVSAARLSNLRHVVTITHEFFQVSFIVSVAFNSTFRPLYSPAVVLSLPLYIDSFGIAQLYLLVLSQDYSFSNLRPSSELFFPIFLDVFLLKEIVTSLSLLDINVPNTELR